MNEPASSSAAGGGVAGAVEGAMWESPKPELSVDGTSFLSMDGSASLPVAHPGCESGGAYPGVNFSQSD